MKIELTQSDYQEIELMRNTLKAISKVGLTVYKNDLEYIYSINKKVHDLLKLHDSAFQSIEYAENEEVSMSSKEWEETLRYKTILTTLSDIPFPEKKNDSEGHKTFYNLFSSHFFAYTESEKFKTEKKEKAQEFFKKANKTEITNAMNTISYQNSIIDELMQDKDSTERTKFIKEYKKNMKKFGITIT